MSKHNRSLSPAGKTSTPKPTVRRGKLAGTLAADERLKVVSAGTDIAVWLIKVAVIGTVGFLVYRSWKNRFVEWKENPKYPKANVTYAQAQARANAIYESIGWFSNSFDQAVTSLSGLNYNGFIRVYNAFGMKRGTLLGGEHDLIGWLKNQFSEEEVQQLSFLTNGVFFKGTPSNNVTLFVNAFDDVTNEELAEIVAAIQNYRYDGQN